MSNDKSKGLKLPENDLAELKKPKGRNFLLVIGIDHYQHFQHLNNAVRDAKGFRDILLEKYQFEQDQVYELFDNHATRKNILTHLEKLEKNIHPEDNLVLYFSGHGMMNDNKTKGFWVPVDAESQADYIPNSRIKDHLDEIKAYHIYLIVDSCFSGSMVARSNEFAKQVETLPSRRVLTSGRSEVVSDGKPGGHSPFASCLIEYLRTYSGTLSASSLEQHVKEYTPRTAHQTPSSAYIYGLGDQGGEFVFHPKKDEEVDWKYASSTGTLKSINDYLDQYPQGKYIPEAMSLIKGLEEEKAWKTASKKNTIFAYRTFLQKYPNSEKAGQAKSDLNILIEDNPHPESKPARDNKPDSPPLEVPKNDPITENTTKPSIINVSQILILSVAWIIAGAISFLFIFLFVKDNSGPRTYVPIAGALSGLVSGLITAWLFKSLNKNLDSNSTIGISLIWMLIGGISFTIWSTSGISYIMWSISGKILFLLINLILIGFFGGSLSFFFAYKKRKGIPNNFYWFVGLDWVIGGTIGALVIWAIVLSIPEKKDIISFGAFFSVSWILMGIIGTVLMLRRIGRSDITFE